MLKNIINFDKSGLGRGGGGHRMWINNSLVWILITSADVDKGGGVKRLSTKCG